MQIPTTTSTGGAGTFFEQHVNAFWLTLLLVRAIPPILKDCGIDEIHLQTKRLKFNTDDFLLVGKNGSGETKRLFGQVKRSFVVSAKNEDSVKVFRDAWKDFKGIDFDFTRDRIAIVTLRGSNNLLDHFNGLLDIAKGASDQRDFDTRLKTSGLVNDTAKTYFNNITSVIEDYEHGPCKPEDIWLFLRTLNLLSFDLNSSTSQTEALAKTLLAYTSAQKDAIGAATATWDALVVLAGEGMPLGRCFTREAIPEALKSEHRECTHADYGPLRNLQNHTKLILDGIPTTIGANYHLNRADLLCSSLDATNSAKIVLISGPAGSGKSVVAKALLSSMTNDSFTFCFRAEEFSCSHLDEALQKSQLDITASKMSTLLAGQSKKVLLIESVERLLEATIRDAFRDLLSLIAKDPTWQVIMTCRDYSTELVKASMLHNIACQTIDILPLTDEELTLITEALPSIAVPLSNGRLKELLRNPYLLDKVSRLEWKADTELPNGEKSLRKYLWSEFIQVNSKRVNALPKRREKTFIEVSLRRARALTMYVDTRDLDSEALEALCHDSILSSSTQSTALMAPKHDVLEDWAILEWLDTEFSRSENSLENLSLLLGAFPAIRRSYRKWIFEQIEQDTPTACEIFKAAVNSEKLPPYFVDDTLVAFLRSPNSRYFLDTYKEKLFENKNQLLKRLIQLMRIACVSTPEWIKDIFGDSVIFEVPNSPSWSQIMALVASKLDSFDSSDHPLLLGLCEDWSRSISTETPYPAGAVAASEISFYLLASVDRYGSEERANTILEVIAKIPKANPTKFETLLFPTGDDTDLLSVSNKLKEMILDEIGATPASRDLPKTVIKLVFETFVSPPATKRKRSWQYGEIESYGALNHNSLFGMQPRMKVDSGPASELRGPFRPLLRYHAEFALQNLVALVNECARRYTEHLKKIEQEPYRLVLQMPTGKQHEQIADGLRWNLYRGKSLGPTFLKSALMALEEWLLSVGKTKPELLDSQLLEILSASTCASLTAVVASVATAFPAAAKETLLCLLTSPACIFFDRKRLSLENGYASVEKIFSNLDRRNTIYYDERRKADARAHRQQDLEAAIRALQLTSHKDKVQELIDKHKSEIPAPGEQTDEHHAWRMSLHRMDLRQYHTSKVTVSESGEITGDTSNNSSDTGSTKILFTPKEPDEDLRELITKTAQQSESTSKILGLKYWAENVFTSSNPTEYPPNQWKERLHEAKTLIEDGETSFDWVPIATSATAAVCIRFHWDQLNKVDKDWCLEKVTSEIHRKCNEWDPLSTSGGIEGVRVSAWVVPLLLSESKSIETQKVLEESLIIALTHPHPEVQICSAQGIGKHLWKSHRPLVLKYLDVIATHGITLYKARNTQHESRQESTEDYRLTAAQLIRAKYSDERLVTKESFKKIDKNEPYGKFSLLLISKVFQEAPDDDLAIEHFRDLAKTLGGWWRQDEEQRYSRRKDFEEERQLLESLEMFIFKSSTPIAIEILDPIIRAVDECPDQVSHVISDLVELEDSLQHTHHFWSLWQAFADEIAQIPWLENVDSRSFWGSGIIYSIFLVTYWKENVCHWKSLEGFQNRLVTLFKRLPCSAAVVTAYIRFLHDIGQESLPDAFVTLSDSLATLIAQGNPPRKEALSLLEKLLKLHVYSKPFELKKTEERRTAVLKILDALVEHGSSPAYRMRDDFVTPLQHS